MGFPRKEYWSGLTFPSSGDLPDPGIGPRSPGLQEVSLPVEPPENCQDNVVVCEYFFFFKFVFNWKIFALQRCAGFCHMSTWISHRYTYVPSLLNLPLTSHPIPPLYFVTEHPAELPASYSKLLLAIYFTHGSVHVSMLLSQFVSSTPFLAVSISLLSMSASPLLPYRFINLPCRFISAIFLDSIYMC